MTTIRRARSGDAAALAELAERTFRDTFTVGNDPADMTLHCAASFGPEVQAREIVDPDWVTIVADDHGLLRGFAQLRPGSPKDCVAAERPSELYRRYGEGRWHGRGIAQQLRGGVMRSAARAGSDRLWLGVWEQNLRALAFYRKYGFEVVGDHVFQFGTDAQTDLIMAANVGGSASA